MKRNLDDINLPKEINEHLKRNDFKSLYENLRDKKVQYQDLNIKNIFKTLYNLDETKDFDIINSLKEISNQYVKFEESGQEDFFTNKNINNFINDLNTNEGFEDFKNNENKITETTAISNKLSSETIDFDIDKTLSEDSN